MKDQNKLPRLQGYNVGYLSYELNLLFSQTLIWDV